MKIGIIAAMQVEMNLILDEFNEVEETVIFNSKFYQGLINTTECVLVKSGIGKVNAAIAAYTLIKEFGCDLILNSGIAGGTKPLEHRDCVVAKSLSYHDFDLTFFGYKYGQVPEMPVCFEPSIDARVLIKSILNKLNIKFKEAKVYSGDQFILSMDQLKGIENPNGIATEMEGAAIAQVCVKCGVDFIVLRYISDIVGDKSQEDYFKFEEDMANQSANITIRLIKGLN
ncbi:MAG: 5'-methylthioadenosine/adenosylhomocysteine nucleosidase [Acholeplasmatales bacterium]|nr:5'-methylthioadenosine/adenosylhomocysteine nucleosidase [Acholeplasmatales bacterium]